METRFQRTECKDSNDIIFIAKTSRLCTFSLFKLQLSWKCSMIFFSKIFYIYLRAPWLGRKFILLFKYIYLVWVKINSERNIYILTGARLKVMCILKNYLQNSKLEYQSYSCGNATGNKMQITACLNIQLKCHVFLWTHAILVLKIIVSGILSKINHLCIVVF